MALADTRSDRHILVLGATGLIGSAINDRLLECGWPVTAAVRKDGPTLRRRS
ncbi:NAD-dependent epimerase/dehydratase family protein [Tsuneonella sp. CC-YZS046]|uniref:NAD-dependent epimerase/dehydratase family protein n=1 Tax=Tsuneonella sp. CC-YZS046 TaxID=3042152 RepID=UPI003A7F2B1C